MQLTVTLPGGPHAGRLPALDELKGLAILLVVLYHAGGVLVWRNLLHGDLGVDLFVLLSGMGLALSRQSDEPPGQFLRRRLLRIAPAYWLALGVYAIGNTIVLERPPTPLNLGLHVVGLHGFFGDFYGLSINDSFWFITLLVTIYGLYLWVRRVPATETVLLIGGVISLAVAFAYFFTGQSGMFAHFGLRLPGFFLGVLLGRLLRDGRLDIGLNATLTLALALLVYVPYTQGIVFHTAVAGLALGAVYVFGLRRALAPAPKVRGALAFLGAHSLEIFLIHQPLLRDYNKIWQIRWFGIEQPTPTTMALGMVVASAVTILLAVELKRLTDRLFARRAA
jgi:peptidoglycan/LPS O-acetylase OafA/YrhL